MQRLHVGKTFPTADSDIDIERVELHHSCASAGAFGCKDGRSATAKWIKDDPVSATAIANEIGDQCHGLHGRMKLQIATTRRMQAVDAWAIDDVRAISPLGAKTKIVDMSGI